MRTIQFTGTEIKIENLHLALGISDNDMPQQSETRVYVVDTEQTEKHHSELTDEEFITLAKQERRAYTLHGFAQAFNYEEVNSFTDVIRFIDVIKTS